MPEARRIQVPDVVDHRRTRRRLAGVRSALALHLLQPAVANGVRAFLDRSRRGPHGRRSRPVTAAGSRS